MALIPIGPWQRDSTYRVHPLGLMDSTYRVPLLDSRLLYVTRGTTTFKVPQDLVEPSLHSGRYIQFFWTLNVVEPHVTYPNLYLEVFFLDLASEKGRDPLIRE